MSNEYNVVDRLLNALPAGAGAHAYRWLASHGVHVFDMDEIVSNVDGKITTKAGRQIINALVIDCTGVGPRQFQQSSSSSTAPTRELLESYLSVYSSKGCVAVDNHLRVSESLHYAHTADIITS